MPDSVAVLSAVKSTDLKITKVVNWSGPNRPKTKLNPTIDWWMTQHQTGNTRDTASAAMHMNFVTKLHGGDDNVSFHLTVDHLEAYQLLPLDEGAYHASDGMDDYTNDVGGWGSIAMELCVNFDNTDDPAKYLKAKQNAVALWAAVLKGDPRLDYGKGGPLRFSADRIAPHNRWAWDRKWCPAQLMNEENMMPWTGNGPFKDAVKVAAGVPSVPAVTYPQGMDEGVATMLFGKVTGDDGKSYSYNPTGQISKRWLARGIGTGAFPEIAQVRTFDLRTYWVFSDGWTLWRTGTGPIAELR